MSSPLETLRVLIIADDPLARAGLATLLAEQPGCVVVGQVAGDADLFAEWDIYQPDSLLWDLGWELPMPADKIADKPSDSASSGVSSTGVIPDEAAESGAQLIFENMADLREADIPVVALLPDAAHAADVWAAGVRGLLLRNADSEGLSMALQAVLKDLIILDPAFEHVLLPAKGLSPPALSEALTPRELDVLHLLAEGLPNKAIAHRLEISDHTVKFHVNAIMTKLGAQSRTEAAVQAARLGLILL